MSIKSLRIETVFSGGIHLIWITLFLLCLLGESPETILCYLSKIQSGMAVILVTILFSLSFFLGRISEHLLIAYNYYCRKRKVGKLRTIIFFSGTQGEVWGNKIFAINSFWGLLLLVIMMLFLSVIYNALNVLWPIILIGVLLILVNWISYRYWYHLGVKLNSQRIRRIRQAEKIEQNTEVKH